MKNIFLLIGFVLITLNTITGLVFSNYVFKNVLVGDVSIALTTLMIYLCYHLQLNDGFKIGFTVFFSLTGIVRFLTARMILENENEFGSIMLVVFLCLLALELVLVFIAKFLKSK